MSVYPKIKVKYLYKFTVGFTPDTTNSSFYSEDENGYIWVNVSDMDNKYIVDSKNKLTEKAVFGRANSLVKKGSLLYSFKLSVGKVAFAATDFYTNEAIASFVPIKHLNLDYLYYSAPIFIELNAYENIYGAKILNQDLIKNAFLPAPPKDKQEKIVVYLNSIVPSIDALIKNEETLITKLKDYKINKITNLVKFGFETSKKQSGIFWLGMIAKTFSIMRFKHVCSVKEGLINPKEEKYHNFPHIGPGNIEKFTGRLLDYGLVKDEDLISGKYLFDEKDVIYGKINPQLGKVCLPGFVGLCSADAYALKVNKKMVNKYLYYFMLSKEFIERTTMVSLRSAMPKINREDLMDIEIVVPGLYDQQKIVDCLDKICSLIDKIIDLKFEKIKKLKEYKESVIFECVTGRRTF